MKIKLWHVLFACVVVSIGAGLTIVAYAQGCSMGSGQGACSMGSAGSTGGSCPMGSTGASQAGCSMGSDGSTGGSCPMGSTGASQAGCSMGSGQTCPMGAGGLHAAGPYADSRYTRDITVTVTDVAKDGATAVVKTAEGPRLLLLCGLSGGGGGQASQALSAGTKVRLRTALVALSVLPTTSASAASAATKTVVLAVGGIECGACTDAVGTSLRAVPGVAQVAFANDGRAKVTYDPAATRVDALIKAVVGTKHPHPGMTFSAKAL